MYSIVIQYFPAYLKFVSVLHKLFIYFGYEFLIYMDLLMAQVVKNLPVMQGTWVQSLGWKEAWRRERLPLQYSGLQNYMDCIGQGDHKELDTTA